MADKLDKANDLWDLLFSPSGDALGELRDKMAMDKGLLRTLTDGAKAQDRFAEEFGWQQSREAEPDQDPPGPERGIDR